MRRPIIKFVLILFFLVLSGYSYAAKVSKDRALQLASDFLKNSTHKSCVPASLKVLRPKNVQTKSSDNEDYFYIIANQAEKGFLLVSADDDFIPILGYSLEGELDMDNLPKNMEKWLDFYKNQMKWAKSNGISSPDKSSWTIESKAGNVVKFLNTATWNQGSPFYLQCPKKNKRPCATGCVATAIAEVMRYYQWPKKGKGTTSEYTCDGGTVTVPSRNLEHDYLWDKMPLTYAVEPYPGEEERAAVATLMADIGAALELDYGLQATSGYELHECLINNFDYSPDLYMEFRDNYYDAQWIEMLKSEIDKGRPIVYSGFDPDQGGHCFVIDGYDDQNYFHVNWGYGEVNNYYLAISAFNYKNQYFYSSYHDALFNFYPNDGTNPEQLRSWLNFEAPGIQCSETSFKKDKTFVIDKISYCNLLPKTFSGKLKLMLINKSGEIIEEYSEYEVNDLRPSFSSFLSNVYVTIKQNIRPGYRIRLFYQEDGTEQWSQFWRDDQGVNLVQEILVADDTDTDNVEVTIGNSGHSSLFSEYKLIVPDNVEVYTYTYDNISGYLVPGDVISSGDVLPAKTGFVVKGAPGKYSFKITSSPSGNYSSELYGTLDEIKTPSGNVYVLAAKSNVVNFCRYKGTKIPAGKVYFIKPE